MLAQRQPEGLQGGPAAASLVPHSSQLSLSSQKATTPPPAPPQVPEPSGHRSEEEQPSPRTRCSGSWPLLGGNYGDFWGCTAVVLQAPWQMLLAQPG